MKKFEYKIINDDSSESFDELGKKGWELVSVVYQSWENERKGYQESDTVFYFKREIKK